MTNVGLYIQKKTSELWIKNWMIKYGTKIKHNIERKANNQNITRKKRTKTKWRIQNEWDCNAMWSFIYSDPLYISYRNG